MSTVAEASFGVDNVNIRQNLGENLVDSKLVKYNDNSYYLKYDGYNLKYDGYNLGIHCGTINNFTPSELISVYYKKTYYLTNFLLNFNIEGAEIYFERISLKNGDIQISMKKKLEYGEGLDISTDMTVELIFNKDKQVKNWKYSEVTAENNEGDDTVVDIQMEWQLSYGDNVDINAYDLEKEKYDSEKARYEEGNVGALKEIEKNETIDSMKSIIERLLNNEVVK